MYCYLCDKYIGTLTTQHFCENCKVIRRIIGVYGEEECKKILEDICLRDEEKRENKVKHAIENNCYSPECRKTRSQTNKEK